MPKHITMDGVVPFPWMGKVTQGKSKTFHYADGATKWDYKDRNAFFGEFTTKGMKTEDAVSHGIRTTAGVVTSAALVMVVVFSIFGSLSTVSMKEIGVGLAVAVLIDATIVRAILLPATMKLLGDWNWWLPRRLHRLPQLNPEAASAADIAPATTR